MYEYCFNRYNKYYDCMLVRYEGIQKRGKAEEKLAGKDGLAYFIPKCYAIRVYHRVKSKRLVPAIPNLVFVHASRSQILNFKKRYNFLQFVMWKKKYGIRIYRCTG